MTTFTSSLPDDILESLSKEAKRMKLPKNKLIEKALSLYLTELKKARYTKSFQKASKTEEIMAIAEEGMADYFEILQNYEEE